MAGKSARLQIVDNATGPWGNIGIAEIVFSDRPATGGGKIEEQADFGTMGLGLLDPQADDPFSAMLPGGKPAAEIAGPPAADAASETLLLARWAGILPWRPASRRPSRS